MESDSIEVLSSSGESETEQEWSQDEEEPSSDSHTHVQGEFFGCYLLVSRNPQYKGRTYIGFTVNPNRRLQQHNAGCHMGGAKKTSGRGPWDMILIVHGFPTDITALQFEWAWQHPDRSRRLKKEIARRKPRKETALQYRFRVMAEMLSIAPWHRLPLTIRWLKQEYEMSFPVSSQPPLHMPIAYGLVGICKKKPEEEEEEEKEEEVEGEGEREPALCLPTCCLCKKATPTSVLTVHCYHKRCPMCSHVTCLAPKFCEVDHVIPIRGTCPVCGRELLWGELVRRLKAAERRKRNKESSSSQSQPLLKRRKQMRVASSDKGGHWTAALHAQ